MINSDRLFEEAFFKTRTFPDFKSVILYMDASAFIGDLFKTCGIDFRFASLPIEVGFDPVLLPDCLVFDHKTNPQFIRQQIGNYHPRKVIITTTYPSSNIIRRFEAVLKDSGYGTDIRFAREAAQAISPRIRSCFFVFEEGAEWVPNSFFIPKDLRLIRDFSPCNLTAANGIAAAELREIKKSNAYKASLMLSRYIRSSKLTYTIAIAVLAFGRRFKNRVKK